MMKEVIEAATKKAIENWNKNHPEGQFIDTGAFKLEIISKKSKKHLLSEIYELKIQNEADKNKSWKDGYDEAIDCYTTKIKDERLVRFNANLALHKEEDCIVNTIGDLIRYARHYKETSDNLASQYEELRVGCINEQRKADNYKGVVKDLIIAEFRNES